MNGGGMDQGYMMQQPSQSLGSMFVGQQQQYVPQQQTYSRPVQQSSRVYRPQQQQSSSRYSSQQQSSSRYSSQQSNQRNSRPVASRTQASPKKAPVRTTVQKKVIGTRVSVTNL